MNTSFITGCAGTGKTFGIREKIKQEPNYGILSASTGIAAVNLSTTTIHSLLKFFNLDTLKDQYYRGFINKNIKELIRKGYQNIIIDEVSMLSGDMLDILYRACVEVNEDCAWSEDESVQGKEIGLILIADFCQLPPVKAKWAFEAECWAAFEDNITRLTKIWRQADEKFITLLNLLRAAKTKDALDLLKSTGFEFAKNVKQSFGGTTILPKNDLVDRYNFLSQQKNPGKIYRLKKLEKGDPPRESRHIPELLELKQNDYVMILANCYDEDTRELIYANGDCGHVVTYLEDSQTVVVKLARTGEEVEVNFIDRLNISNLEPIHKNPFCYEDKRNKVWVLGKVSYMPLRLAYASSVHKTQGLTLDKVQIDITPAFYGEPAMLYTAVSRCRSLENVLIVGNDKIFMRRNTIDKKVLRFV